MIDVTGPIIRDLYLPDIDVTAGAVTVTFSASADDDESGVDRVMLYISRSFSSDGQIASPIFFLDSRDSFADGISLRDYLVDAETASGTYSISGAQVWDKAGNSTYYSAADLDVMGIDTDFQVTSNVPEDFSPPVLTGLSLPDIDLADGPASVTVTATATDEGTGVDRVMLYIDSDGTFVSGGTPASPIILMDSQDSFADGSSSSTYVVDADSPPGTYQISGASIWDNTGNSTYYSLADLQALGIDTSFTVLENIATTTAGDDYVTLTSVSSGGPVREIDAGNGSDTLDATGIYAGAPFMLWSTYEGYDDFVGNNVIRVANYELANFEIILGSQLGANRFFVPDYDRPLTLFGGDYDDYFFGSWDNADVFHGGAGNDDFLVAAGDQAYGGSGNDVFELYLNFSGPAGHIDGGSGTDLLEASFGADVDLDAGLARHGTTGVYASITNVENVEVYAWEGYATSVLGDGHDNHFYVRADRNDGSAGVFFDGRGGDDHLSGSIAADELLGGDGADLLEGHGGDDILSGGAGDDILLPGAGANTLSGGEGADTFDFSPALAGMDGSTITDFEVGDIIALNTAGVAGSSISAFIGMANFNSVAGEYRYFKDSGQTFVQYDSDGDGVADGTLVIANGEFDLGVVTTSGGSHNLLAVNLISGTNNDDFIPGSSEADTMRGGLGDDRYLVDHAGDTVVELPGEGIDTVTATVDFALPGNVENLTLRTGSEIGEGNDLRNIINASPANDAVELHGRGGNDDMRGSKFNDILYGDDGNDTIFGDNGHDYINGGAGEDRILGGAGNDEIDGGADKDLISGNGGADILRGGTGNDILLGFSGEDTLHGDDNNDLLRGGSENDTLFGGAGVDQLFGDDGDDTLHGGAGQDYFNGGAGSDTFVFDEPDMGGNSSGTADRIRDFSQSDGDVIDLSAIDAIPGGLDDPFTFIGDAQFSGTAGELRYIQINQFTMVQMDVDGDGRPDFAVRLEGLIDVVEADFIL